MNQGIELRRVQPFYKNMASKKNEKEANKGKEDIGNERGRLYFIPVVNIFGFTKELDHRITEQALFNGFDQGDNTNKKCPDTHFFRGWEHLFGQNNVTN